MVLCRYLRRLFTEDVVRELLGSSEAISLLEDEWHQLQEDRRALRSGPPGVNIPPSL